MDAFLFCAVSRREFKISMCWFYLVNLSLEIPTYKYIITRFPPAEEKVWMALLNAIFAEKKKEFTTTIFAEEKRTFCLHKLSSQIKPY